jgi:Uncharacterized conserved protein
VCVLIDYQNVHLTARDAFAPSGASARDTLVDPVAFAEKLIEVRSARQRLAGQKLVRLDSIRVYRGIPSNQHEPTLYSAAQRQRAMWERDRRVRMITRTLRYPRDFGRSWCGERPREEGIDVLIALDLVELAREGSYDVLILASHDTDLEPALDRAVQQAGIAGRRVETAGWEGMRRIRPTGRYVWHTFLDGGDYVKVRDRRQYW